MIHNADSSRVRFPELRCDALVLAHLPPEATAGSVLERLPDELPGTAVVVPWIANPHDETR